MISKIYFIKLWHELYIPTMVNSYLISSNKMFDIFSTSYFQKINYMIAAK